MARPRAREAGLKVGELPPGPHNAITDVAGVRVGHTTLIAGGGPLRPGHGPVRAGVTVILPHGDNLFGEKVQGAVHTINGFGKACGFEEVRELGVIEAPIALTNTLNVGLVADALVQSNFGRPRDLTVLGVPLGQHLQPPGGAQQPIQEKGSIMIVLATDAPLSDRQLRRLCVRAAVGLARTGSRHMHGSGDFVIAFSTAYRIEHDPASLTTSRIVLGDERRAMAGLFPAVVECVEEAILNSVCRAETVVGRDGNTRYALPVDEVVALLVRKFRPEAVE